MGAPLGNPTFRGLGNVSLEAMKTVGQEEAQELSAERISSQRAFIDQMEEATNPFAAKFATKEKPIKARLSKTQKAMMAGDKAKALLPIQAIRDTASRFQGKNPELQSRMLLLLRDYIKPGDTLEDILRKIREFYTDPALADEALAFLSETTEGELQEQVKAAKDELEQEFSREIAAGKNIGAVAREAADRGLGSATSLRDLYRDITGNPREVTVLFDELSAKFPYKDLKKVLKFLFHSLGADLKASGPSIPRGLLHRLINEARTLQAILGVYSFFRGRMKLMNKLFAKNGLTVPPGLTFETMAKEFMTLIGDRYPSGEKALQTCVRLGIEKWLMAKIIALSQMRDAIREVAIHLMYRSLQHRDDLYLAILEALEDLEDELEELEEREEKEEDEEEEDQIDKTEEE